MSVKNKIYALTMETFDSASLTTSYQALNSTGLTKPAAILKIVNNSNVDLTVSYDGTNGHDFVPAGGFTLYDFQTNKWFDAAMMPEFTIIYGKSTGAGVGSVYIVAYTMLA